MCASSASNCPVRCLVPAVSVFVWHASAGGRVWALRVCACVCACLCARARAFVLLICLRYPTASLPRHSRSLHITCPGATFETGCSAFAASIPPPEPQALVVDGAGAHDTTGVYMETGQSRALVAPSFCDVRW
jgi:hypothetical protein